MDLVENLILWTESDALPIEVGGMKQNNGGGPFANPPGDMPMSGGDGHHVLVIVEVTNYLAASVGVQ